MEAIWEDRINQRYRVIQAGPQVNPTELRLSFKALSTNILTIHSILNNIITDLQEHLIASISSTDILINIVNFTKTTRSDRN